MNASINKSLLNQYYPLQNDLLTRNQIGFYDCKDPKLDLRDTPKKEQANEAFKDLLNNGFANSQIEKMQKEDTQIGVISVSDFIDQTTPPIPPLAENILDCIKHNKPKIVAFGEIHERAPDLLTLKVASEMMRSGQKVSVLIELPTNLEGLVKRYLKKEITEEDYKNQLYSILTNGKKLSEADQFYAEMFIQNARNLLESFTEQLERLNIPYTFIDDEAIFEIKNTDYVKIPLKIERDKRMSERAKTAIDQFEGTTFMKIGLSHAHEIPNPDLGDQTKHGILPQYTCVSLLAEKYSNDSVLSLAFFTPTSEVTGFKFSDFDRVFNWNEHCTATEMKIYSKYDELGIEIRNESWRDDQAILNNLYVKPKED